MVRVSILDLGRPRGRMVLALAVAMSLAAAANAQETASAEAASIGRVEFDYHGEAKATVEVDLGREMFADLFGIGDAALLGVSQALSQSQEAQQGSDAVRMAAEQAAAAREFVSIAKNVVDEIRIRAYQGLKSETEQQHGVISHYDEQLRSAGWANIVRVRDGDDQVRVSVARADGAIRGLFVVAASGDDLLLVNVTGDISPENAKQLSEAAVRSGLKAGLAKELEKAMKHMH